MMGGLAPFCGLVCSADRFVGRARLGITLPDVNAGTTHGLCDLPKVLNPSVASFPPPYRWERQGLASTFFVRTE